MIEVSYENIPEDNSYEYIIDRVVKEVLKQENIVHDVSVYVRLTDNDGIHKVNKEHRDVDSATDVLSFPMYEKEEVESLKQPKEDDVEETLGDIIISIPKVKEQAEEYGHSVERELSYLVCHGMLHLLGYDHMVDEDKAIMREHEENVLTSLQIFRDVSGEELVERESESKTKIEEDVKEENAGEVVEEPKKEIALETKDEQPIEEAVSETKEEPIEEVTTEVKNEQPIEKKKIEEATEEDIKQESKVELVKMVEQTKLENMLVDSSKEVKEEETKKVEPIKKEQAKVELAKEEPIKINPAKDSVEDKLNYFSIEDNKKTESSGATIVIAFLIVFIIIGLIVMFFINGNNNYSSPSEIIDEFVSGEESGEEFDSGEIIEEEVYLGPAVFSGDSRSIAFMIDNDVKASLPHAGLNNAYMVYEIIVEGGASRLMAVFKYDNLPDKIGPIRSCRHYFLDYVQEHDALYCHIGQSTQGGEALRDRSIQHIETDHARIGPDRTWHNAFALKEKVYKTIENRGWRTTQNQDCILQYNEKDTDLDSSKYADVLTCKFPVSTTVFNYDEKTKTYLIDMKGEPHLDKFNGEQSYAKNILVYKISNQSVWEAWGDHREADNKKRQEIYNTGSGKGYYITNGKAIEMQWSKPSHSSKTSYKDMNGNEIKFNDGITWVEIIPDGGNFTIESNHKETTSGEMRSGD